MLTQTTNELLLEKKVEAMKKKLDAIQGILDDHDADYDPWSDSLESIEDIINE